MPTDARHGSGMRLTGGVPCRSVALWLLVSRSAAGQVNLAAASTISALIGLFCIGPYTLFTGVFPVDCGGSASAGLALGVVDFCGYLVRTYCQYPSDRTRARWNPCGISMMSRMVI